MDLVSTHVRAGEEPGLLSVNHFSLEQFLAISQWLLAGAGPSPTCIYSLTAPFPEPGAPSQ